MLKGGTLAALLALAGCVEPDGQAGMSAAEPPPPAPAPRLSLPDAAARLPAEAAGFRRGQALPARPPARGQEVTYATPAARQRAAALVRLAPVGEVPDGTASPQAQSAFQAELAEAVSGQDRARHLREARRFTLRVAGGAALECAALAGTYGRQPVEGLVCGGVIGGNQLRLKVNMPAAQPPIADAEAFAREMVLALRANR